MGAPCEHEHEHPHEHLHEHLHEPRTCTRTQDQVTLASGANNMLRATLTLSLVSTSLLIGCASIPPASETLPRLRRAIQEPVQSEQQNRDNSALLEQIADAQQLDGMNRQEVIEAIGKGDLCSRHETCAEQGFHAEDWFYEVGVGSTYLKARPILILGFNRFGNVVRTYTMRVD